MHLLLFYEPRNTLGIADKPRIFIVKQSHKAWVCALLSSLYQNKTPSSTKKTGLKALVENTWEPAV